MRWEKSMMAMILIKTYKKKKESKANYIKF